MSDKENFLAAFDREHATTKRVLDAFPADQSELRPSPQLKTARELAFVFAVERGLGMHVWNDGLAKGMPAGGFPTAPATWAEVLGAVEKMHADFRALVASTPDDAMNDEITFFAGPKTMGKYKRIDWLWFILSDEIHHRGQFTIYSRIAGAKVPSIYGPSADEPWT
jgi:uncharacterized damage-inducible protein DinB